MDRLEFGTLEYIQKRRIMRKHKRMQILHNSSKIMFFDI